MEQIEKANAHTIGTNTSLFEHALTMCVFDNDASTYVRDVIAGPPSPSAAGVPGVASKGAGDGDPTATHPGSIPQVICPGMVPEEMLNETLSGTEGGTYVKSNNNDSKSPTPRDPPPGVPVFQQGHCEECGGKFPCTKAECAGNSGAELSAGRQAEKRRSMTRGNSKSTRSGRQNCRAIAVPVQEAAPLRHRRRTGYRLPGVER